MIFSNLKLVSIIAISLLLAACSRDATPRSADSGVSGDVVDSTFVVDTPVTLVQAKQTVENSQWSLANKNEMTFKACMKDVFNNQPIVGEKFLVGWDVSQQTQKTDNQGCVSWTQIISFDYLKDENYVASSAWVEGAGAYRGKRNLPLALDPWAVDNTALVDTRAEPSLAVVTGSTVNGTLALFKSAVTSGSAKQTVIDKVVVEAIDNRYNGTAASVHYHLMLSPQITRRGIKGDMVTTPLVTGQFQLALTLVEHRLQATSAQDQRIILAETTVAAPVLNGLINVDVPMNLLNKPNDQSLVELAFRLIPIDPPFSLLPREGFVQMSGLYAGGDPTVHDLAVSYDAYQRKVRAQTQSLLATQVAATHGVANASASCDDGSSQLGFYLSSVNVRNAGANSRTANENVPNTDIAAFTVCLSDSISKKPVTAGLSVDAALSNIDGTTAQSQSLVTDGNGCLQFTYPISFDYFSSENWLEKSLSLVSHSAPYQEVARNFPISLDPWQNKDQFFWDCRSGQKPTPSGKNVEMEMTDFSTNSIGQEYSIDNAMNLIINRHYQFQITPRLKISSAFGGITSYQDVVDGNYHLRVLVLVPNEDNSVSEIVGMNEETILKKYKYLTSYEGDVKTRDGRIVQEVVLPIRFDELPLLALRNTVLVQISPLDPTSSLISHPYFEAFIGTNANSYFGLSPVGQSNIQSNSTVSSVDLDISSLIQTGKSSKTAILSENTKLEDLARMSKFQIPTVENLNDAGIGVDDLDNIFSSRLPTAAAATKICTLLKANNTSAWYRACRLSPMTHLQFAKIQHVEDITNAKVIDSKYEPMTVSAQISVSTQNSYNSSVANESSNGTSRSNNSIVDDASSSSATNTASNSNSIARGDTSNKSVDATVGTRVVTGAKLGVNIFGSGADVGVEGSAGVSASMGHSWFTTASNTFSNVNSNSNTNSHTNTRGVTNSHTNSRTHTTSTSHNTSRAQDGSVNLNYNKNFGIEELTFEVNGNARDCYGVRSKTSKSPGILLCSTSVTAQKSWNESYYLVSELVGNTELVNLRDVNSRSDAPLAIAIRGAAGFNAVQNLLQNKSASVLLSPTKINSSGIADLDKPLEDFARTSPQFGDGAFPSIVY